VKRLEPEWLSYRTEVVPDSAGAVQVEECRRSFYAGAAALHNIVMTMLDAGAEPTDADIAKMQDLNEELEAFALSFLQTPRRQA
jgi:N-acyl-D-aspartate/D-glutamate deacylase